MQSISSVVKLDPVFAVQAGPEQQEAQKQRRIYYQIALILPVPFDLQDINPCLYNPASKLHLLNKLEAEAEKKNDLALLDLALYWLAEQHDPIKSQEYAAKVSEAWREEAIILSLINQKMLGSADIEWILPRSSVSARLVTAYLKGQGEWLPLDLKGAFVLLDDEMKLMKIYLLLQAVHFLKIGSAEQQKEAFDFIIAQSRNHFTPEYLSTKHEMVRQEFEAVIQTEYKEELHFEYKKLALNCISFNLSALSYIEKNAFVELLEHLQEKHLPTAATLLGDFLTQKAQNILSYENAYRLGDHWASYHLAKKYQEQGNLLRARAWGLLALKHLKDMYSGRTFLSGDLYQPFNAENKTDCAADLIGKECLEPYFKSLIILNNVKKGALPAAPFKSGTEKEKLAHFIHQVFSKEQNECEGQAVKLFSNLPKALVKFSQARFQEELQVLAAKWRNLAFRALSQKEVVEVLHAFQKEKGELIQSQEKKNGEQFQKLLQKSRNRVYLAYSEVLLSRSNSLPLSLDLFYTYPEGGSKEAFLHLLASDEDEDLYKNLDLLFYHKFVNHEGNAKSFSTTPNATSLLFIVEGFGPTLLVQTFNQIDGVNRTLSESQMGDPHYGQQYALMIAMFHLSKKNACAKISTAIEIMQKHFGDLEQEFSRQAWLLFLFLSDHIDYTDEEKKAVSKAIAAIPKEKVLEICFQAYQRKDPIGSLCLVDYYGRRWDLINFIPLVQELGLMDGGKRLIMGGQMLLGASQFREAFQYFKACHQMKSISFFGCVLGLFYETGCWVEKDEKAAQELYQNAADGGGNFGILLLGRKKQRGRVQYYKEHQVTEVQRDVVNTFLRFFNLPEIDLAVNYPKKLPAPTEGEMVHQLRAEMSRVSECVYTYPELQKEYVERLDAITRSALTCFEGRLKEVQAGQWEEVKRSIKEEWSLERLKVEQEVGSRAQVLDAKRRLDQKVRAVAQNCQAQLAKQGVIIGELAAISEQITQVSKNIDAEPELLDKEEKFAETLDIYDRELQKFGQKEERIKQLEALLSAANRQVQELEKKTEQLEQELDKRSEAFSEYDRSVKAMKDAMKREEPKEEGEYKGLFEKAAGLLESEPGVIDLLWKLDKPKPKMRDAIMILGKLGFEQINHVGSHRSFKKSVRNRDYFCTLFSHEDEITQLEKKWCLEAICNSLIK